MRIKRKIWENRGNGQKLVTIPKDSDLNPGDEVWIEEVNDHNL